MYTCLFQISVRINFKSHSMIVSLHFHFELGHLPHTADGQKLALHICIYYLSVCQSTYLPFWHQPSVCLPLNFLAHGEALLYLHLPTLTETKSSLQQHLVTQKLDPHKERTHHLQCSTWEEIYSQSVLSLWRQTMPVAGFTVVWEFWLLWRGETERPSQGGRVLSTGTKSPSWSRRNKGRGNGFRNSGRHTLWWRCSTRLIADRHV